MSSILGYLESQSAISHVTFSIVTIFLIGYVDTSLLPSDVSLLFFYVIPVAQITYFVGFTPGVFFSVFATLFAFMCDHFDFLRFAFVLPPQPSSAFVNLILTFGIFLVIAALTSGLKKAVDVRKDREIELSRTDYVTASANRKYFFELLNQEINRSHRYKHPFTVVYFDVDNFKVVNDMFGHPVGDTLLCAVVETVRLNIRNVDVVARFGDDEFAILLPETGVEQAKTVTEKLRGRLNESMKRLDWPVSFSIGVVTCETKPNSADEVLGLADKLVYDVKKNGKNAVRYKVYNK